MEASEKTNIETCLHEPDWSSLSITFDNEEVYVDVNCKHCGLSGCVGTMKTLGADIQWC